MQQHAFAIEAEGEHGIEVALKWAKRELGMDAKRNPDILVLRYGLFSVEDARKAVDAAAQAPMAGDTKVIIIAASRAYHEAQNALLKLFEEPPPGTYLFLILPTLGGLLSTLRSRVQTLGHDAGSEAQIPTIAQEFLKANREKRGVLAKKLATGKDEDERREHRDEALALVNGIEMAAYLKMKERPSPSLGALLRDISILRGHLHDRSAPVRMILEHLALVTPKELTQ